MDSYRAAKTTLLHAALAAVSPDVAALDHIIRTPARLPTELLLLIRTHLFTAVTTQLYFNSTRALAEYELELQSLLCPDCISYNHDIYGPDIWQWQQFSGPCACLQSDNDEHNRLLNPQQFANPHHWLEHHLSLQASRLLAAHSTTQPSPQLSIWDVVAHVLNRYHCEPVRDDLDDYSWIQSSSSDRINIYYHRRLLEYYGSLRVVKTPPVVHIRPSANALCLYENQGIGEAGEMGDMFRSQVIVGRVIQDLGLKSELKDVFSLSREFPQSHISWSACRNGASSDKSLSQSTLLFHLYTSPALQCVLKTYSVVSSVLAAFISMPMTIATIALTVLCFYSRPVALRVGVPMWTGGFDPWHR